MKRYILTLALNLFLLANSNAIVYVSAVAGSWDTPANWSPVGRPTTGDNVTVNHAMTIATPVNISIFILGAAGSVSVGTQTLTLNSTVTGLGGTITSSSTGTVTYNQASNGQNVLAGSYGNLTFSNFNKVLAAAGNININNLFTPGAAIAHTIVGSTIRYTNVSNIVQTIQPFHYNNITVLNSSAPGYKNFVGSMQIDGVFTPPSNLQYCTGCNASTIDFSGSGAQTIPVFYYNNLTSSSTGARTLASSGTIRIYGVFTPGANSYTVTGSTIDYHSNQNQTIQPFSYNNLTVFGSNVGFIKTFSGVINIFGVFVPPNNFRYGTIGNTINYNGTGAQTIKGNFYYGTLQSSSTGARTLDPTFIIDVYTAFIPGTNAYTITNSTIRYAGSVSETIAAFTYNHLISSGTGARVWDNLANVIIRRNFTAGTNTYTATGSTVVFSGIVSQTITGSCTWNNLTINNATIGGVTIASGTHTLTGALNVGASLFTVGSNSFTLMSNASATARVGVLIGGGSIVGTNFIVQRYVSARSANYADLASPVTAETIAGWDTRPDGSNEIYMSGVGGPDGGAFGPGNSVFTWNEPTAAFVAVTSQATALTPGKGFELFLGDDLNNLNALTFDSRGTLTQQTQNVPGLTFTGDGYNLIGNPFASYISWNTVLASSTNIDNTYLIFDAAIGNYVSYGAGTEIPASQGFYIHATAAPTVSITEASKTATVTSVFHKQAAQEPCLSLKLYKTDNSIPFSHETKIFANEASSDIYDNGDLPFMKSPVKEAPSITTTSIDGKILYHNIIGKDYSSIDIPVNVSVGISGQYTIEAQGLKYAGNYSCVTLEDTKTGTIINLKEKNNCTFTSTVGDSKDRFVLHLNNSNCVSGNQTANTPALSDEITIVKNESGNNVIFRLAQVEQVTIKVVNVLGQVIVDEINENIQEGTIKVTLPVYNGIYYVTVVTQNGSITKKFVN